MFIDGLLFFNGYELRSYWAEVIKLAMYFTIKSSQWEIWEPDATSKVIELQQSSSWDKLKQSQIWRGTLRNGHYFNKTYEFFFSIFHERVIFLVFGTSISCVHGRPLHVCQFQSKTGTSVHSALFMPKLNAKWDKIKFKRNPAII